MHAFENTITPDFAREVVDEMRDMSIPLSAKTYHVWFAHRAGWYPELTLDIEREVMRGRAISERFFGDLYVKHISHGRRAAALLEAQYSARQLIDSVCVDVEGSSGAASEYRGELNRYVDRLGMAANIDDVREIVKGLIIQTSKMASASNGLKENLQQATNDMEKLRERMVQLERDNLTDPLTGLNNRKALDRHIKVCFEVFESSGTPFCVLMLDVDHFKSFNDTYGHDVGDAVLRSVSSTLADTGHPAATPHRYGGEEFCILVGNCALSEAVQLGEAIREQIAGRQLKAARTGQKIDPITISVGVAMAAITDAPDDVVERADKALYFAKESGRNNVKTERHLELKSPSPR